ncbi:hypothetical protein MTO96_011629 [Rhipicephalus appendiculatus]
MAEAPSPGFRSEPGLERFLEIKGGCFHYDEISCRGSAFYLFGIDDSQVWRLGKNAQARNYLQVSKAGPGESHRSGLYRGLFVDGLPHQSNLDKEIRWSGHLPYSGAQRLCILEILEAAFCCE